MLAQQVPEAYRDAAMLAIALFAAVPLLSMAAFALFRRLARPHYPAAIAPSSPLPTGLRLDRTDRLDNDPDDGRFHGWQHADPVYLDGGDDRPPWRDFEPPSEADRAWWSANAPHYHPEAP